MTDPPTPSITTWTRLEPRARDDSLAPSLEARVYDPAWLLARQWQIAEFRGQDAAFPVEMTFTVDVQPVADYGPPSGAPAGPYPLEAYAWPEPPTPRTTGADAELGAELVRMLTENGCSAAGVAALVAAYPITTTASALADATGAAYLGLLVGRLPNSTLIEPILRQAVAPGGSLPPGIGVADDDVPAVMATATQWLSMLDDIEVSSSTAADPWQPSVLDHEFSVTVGSTSGPPFTLRAQQWPGRRLEWFDFDVPAQPAAAGPTRLPTLPGVDPGSWTVSGEAVPHALSYPGAPARRHWTFEDGNVNLSAVTVGRDDLARMLIVDFATVYGNDWYLHPLPLPLGALHTVTQLVVTNSFGETEGLGPVAGGIPQFGSSSAGPSDWSMFQSAVRYDDGSHDVLNGLLLPPTIADLQRSPAIEEVLFVRDDVADIGWGIEQTALGADDRPFDRYSGEAQQQAPADPTPPADDGSTVRYLLQTDVPTYCFPLLPTASDQPSLQLVLVRRVGTDGQAHDLPPVGRILAALQQQPLFDRELATFGTTVRRRRYLTRGFGGEVLLWTGREREAGAHFPSVALAYDRVVTR